MGWFWNVKAQRYQWVNGRARFLSRTEALGYVEESIAATGNATDVLANYVTEGLLAPADWRVMMREEIKGEYIRQYLLGIGGREQMTQADWGSIGGMLKEQYGYLDKMAELVAKEQLSEGQIRSRSKMYINSAREAYERAQGRVAERAGFDEVSWVLNISAEHCPDCEAFSDLGWQKVADDPYSGAYPGSGDTVCLTSCQCALEYKNSETGEQLWAEELTE